jgi:hypothetical protein
MKIKIINSAILLSALGVLAMTGCTKLLDTKPITQVVTPAKNDSSISSTTAEALMQGMYGEFKGSGYGPGIEFNVLDRITNGDVISDNCYAGGDNPDNMALDLFSYNALNGNIARDWSDCYYVIGKINNAIAEIEPSTNPSLTVTRKNEMLGECRFMRAFEYFDAVRLWGNIPIVLTPPDATNSETLIKTSGGLQSPPDTVYQAILSDLWYAKSTVSEVGANASKYIVSKGAVDALLAKVYATMSPAKWDSVAYYCDQVMPKYSLLPNYSDLWDINNKNNSESIWEIQYDGYSSSVGNWIPSQFIGDGWKKFETPTNDLVNTFTAEHDNVRLNASIAFVTYGWPDQYWTVPTNYPVLSKYTDPNNGYNNMYMLRLADILLLRAEAYNAQGDVADAATVVNQVRARVGLPAIPAANPGDMALAIEKERRLELAFEGQRWYDLLRTGRALDVMNAQKDGAGNSLNYNVPAYKLLLPIPQTQLDLNPLLIQNPGY